ncbi:MAG: NUDIX hydrolase [Nitrospinae bacterium]|nr:NUDIX hydrolase [Nitrospinota bacterium]
MKLEIKCPQCGHGVAVRQNPYLTVDIIIEVGEKIVLIERRGGPEGFALPGGYVDYGETVEQAAAREAKEETGLDVTLTRQFHVYSDPARDPRRHNASVVFIGNAQGVPVGSDDAKSAALFSKAEIPLEKLVFDHSKIMGDYLGGRY